MSCWSGWKDRIIDGCVWGGRVGGGVLRGHEELLCLWCLVRALKPFTFSGSCPGR